MFLNARNILNKEKHVSKIKDAKGFSIGEIKKAGIKLTEIPKLSFQTKEEIRIDTRRISIYDKNVEILKGLKEEMNKLEKSNKK